MSDEELLLTADARGLHRDDIIALVAILRRDHAAAVAERDHLRTVCDAVGAESIADIVAQRDHLQAVVEGERELRARLAGARCARDEAIAERDRLQSRVAWLRRAYGKAWLRRWSMRGIIRDVDNARRSAKAERDRLQAVVDADPLWKPVLVLLANIDAAPQGSDVFELSASPAVTAMREALRQRREQLDASPTGEDM